MKLYSQADFQSNAAEKRREICVALAVSLPFLAIAIAAFALRKEGLCMAGCLLSGTLLILLYDLRIGPVFHYGRFLREVHSGLTRRTLGTLVRVSEDLVYQDRIYAREITINIYEDMDEEGERRFLLDREKALPDDWLGQDVVITSHGSFVLEAQRPGEAAA